MLIKGIPIIYVNRTKTGADAFGVDIYTETEETINNVLFTTASETDIPETNDLTKRKEVYILGIPKGDNHDWIDCIVKINGERFKSVGFPVQGIETLVPTDWHKKVRVIRCE